jgi:SAM-dependent methyltransferase
MAERPDDDDPQHVHDLQGPDEHGHDEHLRDDAHRPDEHRHDEHPHDEHRHLVDYGAEADRYDRGRALLPEGLVRWRDAVRERLPAGALSRVVDVGAGTGGFLPMWRDLGASLVVGVEPTAAMRARAGARVGGGAVLAAGTGERLPLRSGSMDVAWVSAVIHHLADVDAAARELGRVVRPSGRVLVRGLFPGTSVLPWLDHMPGADRARGRFPTVDRLSGVLARAGLDVVDVTNVVEAHRHDHTAAEAADWIEAMRTADSVLTALRDDEVAAGVAALRAMGDAQLGPIALTLVTAAPRR